MPRQVDELEFRADAAEAVVARMEGLLTRRDGWVNLQPGIPEKDAPPAPSGLAALFGSPSFPVPVCTWVPGRAGLRGLAPDTIGIQHATGPKAVRRLAEQGVPLPAGWRWRQDHPRRGLVVELPPDTAPAEVLDWLLRAGAALSTVTGTGDWRAEFHRSS